MGKGGAASVAGSQVSSLQSDGSSNGVALLRPGHEDDLLDERAFSVGVMGLMYTVCKEKAVYGWLFVTFRLLADWLQLFLIVVQAYWYDIDDKQLWWRVLNFIQLNQFMSARGYTFFLGAFYILVIGLIVSVVISVWVGWSFHANRFDHVWPIVFLRWFAKIFYQVLDVMSMTLFLMTLDCQYFGLRPEVRFYNQQFPEVYCWETPHLIHVGVGVVSLCVFVVLAGAFTMGEMELNITTSNPLAIMHTRVELESFILRVLMTLVSVFVPDWKWLSVAEMLLAGRLAYIIIWWQPHMYGWVNHIRSGTYFSVWWCAVIFILRAFYLGVDQKDEEAKEENTHMLTIVMWATFFPAGLLGSFLSWLRLRYFHVTVLDRFKHLPRDTPYHKLYEATDSRQIEVMVRSCRVWVDKDVLDPEAVALAEQVVLLGLYQLPKDPFMIILYSSFLIDVQSSYHSGYSQLQAAKKADSSFLMRFAIFSREQQHTQKSAGGGGGQPTDLVSYVEFQRNFSLVLRTHREALTTMRHFWECMMHRTVQFQALAEAIKRMDTAVRQAERVYKQVLGRHASNVKIVRLYAKFLEHVKHDPWSASRWFTEADKLEQQEEENKNHDAFNGMDMATPEVRALFSGVGGAQAEGRAVVIINAQGLIQMTNHNTLEVFGYTKAELHGKSMNLLMPPPFSSAHTGFLRNYIATGRTKVLNRTMQQLGMHKDRQLLPLMITVTRVSGIGEDTMIMGVMEVITPAPGTATLWLSSAGTFMSIDENATDWLAYEPQDLVGMPITTLAVKRHKAIEDALKHARASIMLAQHMHNKEVLSNAGNESGNVMSPLSPRLAHMTARARSTTIARINSGDQYLQLDVLSGPSKMASEMMELVNRNPNQSEWVAENVLLGHKYADPVEVNVTITNAGAGSMQFHVLTLSKSGDTPLPHAASSKMPDDWESEGFRPAPIMHQPSTNHRGRRASVMFKDPETWPPNQELMVVVDNSGRVLHISSALAERLGRTVMAARGNGVTGAMEGLMVEPFAQLHSALASPFPAHAPPPYSCRAGLSVLMQGLGPQGRRQALPFRLALKRRPGNGLEEPYHVATMQQCTLGFALNERRLAVQVDVATGRIVNTSNTPASLFGFDPMQLIGTSISSILDILKDCLDPDASQEPLPFKTSLMPTPGMRAPVVPRESSRAPAVIEDVIADSEEPDEGNEAGQAEGAESPSSARLDTPSAEELAPSAPGPIGEGMEDPDDVRAQSHLMAVLEARSTTGTTRHHDGADLKTRLVELAARASQGACWRVGVCAPIDEVEAALAGGLAPLGRVLPTKPVFKPAIMQIKRVIPASSHGTGPSSLHLELELWRADLGCSVLELDNAGNIAASNDPAVAALYPPGLVLGAPASEMVDHHVSTYLPPLKAAPLSDLFVAGAFGPPPPAPGTRRAYEAAPKVRSTLKRKESGASIVKAGPVQTMRLRHMTDGGELEVSFQAVRKPGGGMYLVLHPVASKVAPHDFWKHIALQAGLGGDMPDSEGAVVSKGGYAPRLEDLLLPRVPTPPLVSMPIGEVPARPSRRGNVQWGEDEVQGARVTPSAVAPGASHLVLGDQVMSPTLKPKHAKSNAQVAAWLAGQSIGAAHNGHIVSDPGNERSSRGGSGDDSSEGEPAAANQEQEEQVEEEEGDTSVPEDADGDTQGVTDGDYNRAQRFKKLYRLLSSSVVQKPMVRLRNHAAAVMIGLTMVHLGMFVVMFQGIAKLKKEVAGLHLIGQAAVRSTRVASYTRAMNVLYSNMSVPHLRELRSIDDLPALKQTYRTRIDDFMEYHSKVYLGSSTNQPIPDKYGLGELWSMNTINITLVSDISVNQSLANFTTRFFYYAPVMVSLYEAGNLIVAKASSLLQRADEFNKTLTNPADFAKATELQFVTMNAPKLIEGYLTSMDSYVQVVIDSATEVNQVQLILLALEGCALCLVCTAWVWHLLQDVASLRYSMMAVFTAVPQGLIRRLATQKHRLTDDDEHDDEDDINPKLTQASKPAANSGEGGDNQQGKAVQSIKLHVKVSEDVEGGKGADAKPTGWRAVLRCLPGMRRIGADRHRKRRLQRSLHASLWLVWPFVVWGGLVIVADGVGYFLLSTITAPVALFNICNSVAIMYSRNLFFLKELVFEQDVTKMDDHRKGVQRRVLELKKDFEVMLYSNKAAPQETSPHYTLVTKGIVDSGAGTDILFGTNQCLCLNPADCLPPDDELYPYTMNGLERMIIRYIEMGHYIPQFQHLDPYINGPEYKYYWNTRPDMFGGFTRIVDVYHGFVISNLDRVLTVHIVIFVLVVLLCVGYLALMLRPFMRSTSYETRRVAELLSQLPQEVDMDALLSRTLLADLGVSTGESAPPAGAPGGHPPANKFAKLKENNSSMARGSGKM